MAHEEGAGAGPAGRPRLTDLDPACFSARYAVRRLGEGDLPALLALCRGNRGYYRHCPPFVSEESLRADMTALPSAAGPESKHYAGYLDGGRLIAVLDLIAGYPQPDAAFIGFFMTDRAIQRRGVGSAIIGELSQCLRQRGCARLSLAWVRGNRQAERFWRRNGFEAAGTRGDAAGRQLVLARRELAGAREGEPG